MGFPGKTAKKNVCALAVHMEGVCVRGRSEPCVETATRCHQPGRAGKGISSRSNRETKGSEVSVVNASGRVWPKAFQAAESLGIGLTTLLGALCLQSGSSALFWEMPMRKRTKHLFQDSPGSVGSPGPSSSPHAVSPYLAETQAGRSRPPAKRLLSVSFFFFGGGGRQDFSV